MYLTSHFHPFKRWKLNFIFSQVLVSSCCVFHLPISCKIFLSTYLFSVFVSLPFQTLKIVRCPLLCFAWIIENYNPSFCTTFSLSLCLPFDINHLFLSLFVYLFFSLYISLSVLLSTTTIFAIMSLHVLNNDFFLLYLSFDINHLYLSVFVCPYACSFLHKHFQKNEYIYF